MKPPLSEVAIVIIIIITIPGPPQMSVGVDVTLQRRTRFGVRAEDKGIR